MKGWFLVYRVFDVAEEFDLPMVEKILVERGGSSRLRLARSTGQAFVMRNAPLKLSLGEVTLRIGDQSRQAEVFARVWDYGVLSFQFQLPIREGMAWSELVDWGARIEDNNDIDEVSRRLSRELKAALSAACKSPYDWDGIEDYVIYYLENVRGVTRASELLTAVDVPALILGEPDSSLAPRIRSSILDNVYQYGEGDLAVIDWNSAVVIEPSGVRDVVDVIEFALTHLMEFRFYDDLLDTRLDVLYDSIERGRGANVFRSRYWRLSHEASSMFIEFSAFLERVENSLKVVGDFYLATIFRGAAGRFRLFDWEESITRKLNILARVSELLQGEVNVQRSHWLEVVIIVLIGWEIVSALLTL